MSFSNKYQMETLFQVFENCFCQGKGSSFLILSKASENPFKVPCKTFHGFAPNFLMIFEIFYELFRKLL